MPVLVQFVATVIVPPGGALNVPVLTKCPKVPRLSIVQLEPLIVMVPAFVIVLETQLPVAVREAPACTVTKA